MSAEIIQFGKPSTTRRSNIIAADMEADCNTDVCEGKPRAKMATTTTAKNWRIRYELRQAWSKADAATDYWNALLKFHDAISIAVLRGLREACATEKAFGHESRNHALDMYREAVRRQIFTPAPDVAAVNWKRTHLKQALYVGAKKERMEQIIADDLAFLKAHPTRRDRAASSES